MAKTPSNMVSLGTKAPDFNLLDVTIDSFKSLDELKGDKGTVIMFICNHCPYVKHVNTTIVEIAKKYQQSVIKFIAISSNDVLNYPEDSPELMKENAIEYNFCFPYLYDETQQTAIVYDAACTPDFYVYNSDLELVYRGQLDDSRPGNNIDCDGTDLVNAINCLCNNEINTRPQKPSIGCNIKWKTN
jgi:thiol-disulfide isomerase/thioredoxin